MTDLPAPTATPSTTPIRTPRGGITRRSLPLAAAAGLALGAQGCDGPAPAPPKPKSGAFPKGFVWGAATAAFQIEGSLGADGRGESVWDRFQADGGPIKDHSTAAIATDSYRRWPEDVDALAGASLNAYRFSIAWPRIQPNGAGPANEAGLDHYKRLADALVEKGIAPYATLFHWDLPQALQDKGGWAARDTAARLGDYADIIARRLGDRIRTLIVLNEGFVHAIVGHVLGQHAPGLRDPKLIGPVIHHLNLGQGLALQALRAADPGLNLGTTMALAPVRPAGGPLALWNWLPVRALDAVSNTAFLDPVFKGSYPSAMAGFLGDVVRDGDLAVTRQRLDFLGVNYYAPNYMRLDVSAPGLVAPGSPPSGAPLDAFGRHIDPGGLAEVLARLRRDYGNPKVMITETGCSDPLGSRPARLDDDFRIAFLANHLAATRVAMEAGSDIAGFFVWTLVDNWEWADGFTAKFGLIAQDGPGGERRPKASYDWYRRVAAANALPKAEG